MKRRNLFLVNIFIIVFLNLKAQEFYINTEDQLIMTFHEISPRWVDLNYNEGRQFLINAGFNEIDFIDSGSKKIIRGFLSKEYGYARSLVFEDQVIKEYKDAIMFYMMCDLCFANQFMDEVKKTTPYLVNSMKETYDNAVREDRELKEKLLSAHKQMLERDGMEPKLMGSIKDFGFEFQNNIQFDDKSIYRTIRLNLLEDVKYQYWSQKRVVLNNKNYVVSGNDLKNISTYDLPLMINTFLDDCAENGINVKRGAIKSSFEMLSGTTLGLSYGIYDDQNIIIKIDPQKWSEASIPKRWYLLYHELGHDVLNLEHGEGGKMMFNFADKGYSWNEFWEDRAYMFKAFKTNQK